VYIIVHMPVSKIRLNTHICTIFIRMSTANEVVTHFLYKFDLCYKNTAGSNLTFQIVECLISSTKAMLIYFTFSQRIMNLV
jgi:hypothetical protein